MFFDRLYKLFFHFDAILQGLIQAVNRSVKNLMQSAFLSSPAGMLSRPGAFLFFWANTAYFTSSNVMQLPQGIIASFLMVTVTAADGFSLLETVVNRPLKSLCHFSITFGKEEIALSFSVFSR